MSPKGVNPLPGKKQAEKVLTNPDVVVVSVLRYELKKPAPAKPPRLR